MKPDQTQHDGSAACVIAQQYSSHCTFIPAGKTFAQDFFFSFFKLRASR
jgi:predicted SnoaL-like aldol condensation-catalyzing enzyme